MGWTLKGLRSFGLLGGLLLVPGLAAADPSSAPTQGEPSASRAARSAVLSRSLDRAGDLRERVLLHTRVDRTVGDAPRSPLSPKPRRAAAKHAHLRRSLDRASDRREARLAGLRFSRRHAVLARLRDLSGDRDEYLTWRLDLLRHGPSRANPNMVDQVVNRAFNETLQRRADAVRDQREAEEEEQSQQRNERADERDLERDLQDDRRREREDEREDDELLEEEELELEGDERAEERELERAEEAEVERTIQAEEDGGLPE
jgi:hypothetical protein